MHIWDSVNRIVFSDDDIGIDGIRFYAWENGAQEETIQIGFQLKNISINGYNHLYMIFSKKDGVIYRGEGPSKPLTTIWQK